MILAKTFEEARASRHQGELFNGTRYWRSDYFGFSKSGLDAPQAFYVEQFPSTVVPPHFHEVNQFQVVVGGGGILGKHGLRPVAVHYAGGHTGYGPLTADTEGLNYFTLRPCADHGAQFLPQCRDKIRYSPIRRNAFGSEIEPWVEQALKGLSVPRLETVLDGYDDGLGAWLLRLGAGATARAPGRQQGGGQYHLVLNGSLRHGEEILARHACLFVSADEAPQQVTAGAEGLELLILQYPSGQAALRA
ncbi:MAG: hypothetical protein O7A69_07545 [SAR324 cluster bacterium]|nr:hypothetical protein [SAR324 cluster bacterium]